MLACCCPHAVPSWGSEHICTCTHASTFAEDLCSYHEYRFRQKQAKTRQEANMLADQAFLAISCSTVVSSPARKDYVSLLSFISNSGGSSNYLNKHLLCTKHYTWPFAHIFSSSILTISRARWLIVITQASHLFQI